MVALLGDVRRNPPDWLYSAAGLDRLPHPDYREMRKAGPPNPSETLSDWAN